MAHPSKFVSTNLNKSYGHPSSTSSAFSNGRPRSMVVLSRPRSSGSSMVGQTTPKKVSVPPPMNLPSLRKEHERFNPSSVPGSGSRPGSSGPGSSTMGWTKPYKDGGTPAVGSGSKPIGQLERAVLLRGEEFPSLRATVASGNASGQKQKQKHPEEGEAEPHRPLDMRPHMRSSSTLTNGPPERNEVSNRQIAEKSRKPDGSFLGLFPLAPLSHTSDWADDERDTALGIPERGFSRTAHDIGGGSVLSREFPRGDLLGRDLSSTVKDGMDSSSWRAPQARDGAGYRDFGFDGDRMGAKASPLRKQMSKESDNGQGQSTHKDGAWNSYSNGGGSQDGRYHRKDLGYGNNIHNGRNMEATFNGRTFDHNMRGGDTFQNRPMSKGPFSSGDKGHPLNDPVLNFGREKRSISNGGKQYVEVPGLDITDPFSGAPIGEVNIKVFKKKDMSKQVAFYDPVRESFEAELERVQRMQELERQRVSEEQARALELARREHEERERFIREEEERRWRVEEQARESAWRAEQEKLDAAKRIEEQKNAREEEKRRIVLEEDRRKEAAHKKLLELEARIAKRQAEVSFVDTKLTSAGDTSGSGKERDVLRGSDVGDWEDGERMVESITNTAASDTSSLNKFFDAGSRPHSSRDHSSSFMDRGTHANNWRREVYDHENSSMFLLQNQESDHHSSRRGAFNSGINLSKKEAHGNIGPSLRPSSGGGGTSKPSQRVNDLRHVSGNRWNIGGDGDYFNKNSDFDAEFIDDDKFGDITWGNGRSHRSSHAPYMESSYQNYEVDGFSSFERSRHSLRQPRVLPPPSISSMPKSSIGPATLRTSSPSFLDCEMRYRHDRNPDEGSYDRVCNENLQQPGVTGSLAENLVPSEQINDKNSQRCESQSSLSVSSPPASPTHLSHDDLDESESSQLLATSAIEEEHAVLTQDKHVVSASEVAHGDIIVSSSSDSHGEDEWAAESHELILQQDVYDEYDDEYQDEEEAHEGIGEILDTSQEFEDIQSDVLDTTDEVDQVVSRFDEGDEVRIPHNDEFENTCRSNEMTVGVQSGSVGATQELIRSGGIGMGTENAFTEGSVNEFSRKINETEKALQELVLDPVLSTSYLPDATSNLGTSVQHPVLSGLNSTIPSTSSVQPIRPSISTVRSQSELPVKLQFGLFSGPPLIPCPVPTIQIGSIQMPLHPHPQVGPIAQIHPSQPSFFQFGQLSYPSPISQGILPLAPLSMSFVQAPPPSSYFLNQNHEGSTNKVSQESSFLNNSEDKVVSASVPTDKLVVKPVVPAQDNIEGRKINLLPDHRGNQAASQSQTSSSSFGGLKKSRHGSASASQSEHYGIRDGTMERNYRSNLNNREPALHSELNSSQFFSGENALGDGSKDPGAVSRIRGKRFAYPARNAGSRPFFPEAEASYTDLSGFRRTPRRNIRRMEFRVREGFSRMQNDSETFNDFGQDGKLNYNLNASGNSARYRGKKDVVPSKSTRITIESQNINSAARNSREVVFDDKMGKVSGKDSSSKKRTSFVGNSYESFEENDYDDAPLQNGVVRVFKQSGIEAPSDEDDFIQVRSKRQMLNDRREQREKEIKAKSRGAKIARKIQAVPRSNVDTYLPNKAVAPSLADAFKSIRSNPNIANVNHFTNVEASHVFVANVASQSLPPIGIAINLDLGTNSERLKSSERRSMSAISSCGTNFVSGLSFDNNSSFPLGSWDNADINQQVMALTQSELDESMQSTLFDSHVVSSISHEPNEPVTSIATPEKIFAPSASPLDSSLVGEKIQFGAVTSPTILPPVSRTVSNGFGPPVSGRSEVVMSPKLPTVENDFTVFFDQEKCPDESCTHIEDPETEAAASVVTVAAISNNEEIVGNRLGAGSIPVPDTKNFSAPVATMPNSGGSVMAAVQEVVGQSTSEGSLTVSLPADLLVDSSSLPLWQPLPGPQSSSGTMLSHFPAVPSSHFPFFEMNPMLGGPLFSFGPHEGSPGTQAQAQRSAPLGSGPLGAWPHCHPAMESFYIPPAGFAGPFIGPEGIPGGQGPHMVVYNHFNPVGQYGQVGSGFMGTSFIPSVKQPDWKHNPVSPVVGVGEGEVISINVVSGQRNSPVIPAPIRHFAPGSSIVPTASPPLAMYGMTPFQSSADLPLQARWSHIPAPPIHSVLLPVQQHDGIPPSQFTRVFPVDTPTGNYWFNDPRLSKAADGNRSISVPKVASPQFLNEPLTSRTDGVQKHGPYSSSSSGNDNNSSKGFNHPNSSMVNSGKFTVGQSFKPQPPQKLAPSGQQYLHPVGYSGRNQSSGPSKNFASSKVKQVYVAKSHTGGRAATG